MLLVTIPFGVTALVAVLSDRRTSVRLSSMASDGLVISFGSTLVSIIWTGIGVFFGVQIDWTSISQEIEPIAVVLVFAFFLVGFPLLGVLAEGSVAKEASALMEGYLDLTKKDKVYFTTIGYVFFGGTPDLAADKLLWGSIGMNGNRESPVIQGVSKFMVQWKNATIEFLERRVKGEEVLLFIDDPSRIREVVKKTSEAGGKVTGCLSLAFSEELGKVAGELGIPIEFPKSAQLEMGTSRNS